MREREKERERERERERTWMEVKGEDRTEGKMKESYERRRQNWARKKRRNALEKNGPVK